MSLAYDLFYQTNLSQPFLALGTLNIKSKYLEYFKTTQKEPTLPNFHKNNSLKILRHTWKSSRLTSELRHTG